jgi:uncharacterized protein (TIGR03000 family)
MYSIVLVTALTAGTTAPGWHHGGYYGGYNYGYAGPGCYGCNGCNGCLGCQLSCGCYGAWTFGGYGFAGGGFGYHGGCYGAYGNWYGAVVCSGCYGCHGGYSGYGMPVPMEPVPVIKEKVAEPPVPMIKKDEKEIVVPKEGKEEKKPEIKKEDIKKDDGKKPEKTAQVRARVRIDLPEGGKLFVDGKQIPSPAGVRIFHTPLLSVGQKYFYDIRIEVERDGRVVSDQRRIVLQAGQEVAVAFPNLTPRGPVVVRAEE